MALEEQIVSLSDFLVGLKFITGDRMIISVTQRVPVVIMETELATLKKIVTTLELSLIHCRVYS